MGMGMAKELQPDVWKVRKKLQMTTYTILKNTYLAKVAVKSAPGVPDVAQWSEVYAVLTDGKNIEA